MIRFLTEPDLYVEQKKLMQESKEKMSRLLNELIGKKCSITDSFMGYQGTVIDCDDDWVKIQVANKKKTIKLCPIDEIQSIEILEDKEKV